MGKSFITIGGNTYRVEVNWNALANFLTLIGEDSIAGLTRIDEFRVSQIPALIAATIEEGERLEGREVKLDPRDLGTVLNPFHLRKFMDIYTEHSRVWMEEEDDAKKKESPQP